MLQGRSSEFKPLTEDDIAAMEDKEYEEEADQGWYIADTFGTRNESFGSKVGDGISEKNFNKFLKDLYGKRRSGDISKFSLYVRNISCYIPSLSCFILSAIQLSISFASLVNLPICRIM